MNIQLPDAACTGCGACFKICKTDAITMEPQEDGFLYPIIDADKCVSCGLCMKACHALGAKDYSKPFACYAAQIKKPDVLSVSTSGGLFYALATNVLDYGGVVYGCIFNEHYDAVISRAETMDQMQPMHGSKYVWSDSSYSFPSVKKDLESGRQVLYTCLPCQAAGLKKYLGRQYDNLFIVDVLCGGAPSPYAFQQYLATLTDETGKKALHFQFRDKEKYGSGVDCTYLLNGEKHHENYLENSFYFAFCSKSRITWRKSCYGCDYKSIHRVSDMTIGDYWGVEKHHDSFLPKDGVSVILINTEKGGELFDRIKDNIRYEESKVSYATERNSLVNEIEEGYVKIPENRDAFFRTLKTDGWRKADQKYLSERKKILSQQKKAKMIRKVRGILKR